jgi:APA family basic amino acid/polyamine antiporter
MQSEFKKEIKLFDAVMLVAGTMIGSGIFIVSADISRNVGSSGWMLVTWLISGFITMAGALSYGELSGMFPKAGGQYIYLKEAYGKLIAFLYGWTLFLVIQTGTIAAVGVAFAKFTGVIWPTLGENHILYSNAANTFKITAAQCLAIVVTLFLTYINSRGVKNGKYIQNIFGVTKIGALLLLIIFALLLGVNSEVVAANFADMWSAKQTIVEDGVVTKIESISGQALALAIGVAMVGSLFSSDAWNNVTFAGDEIVNPQKTIGRSLIIGTGLVTVIYILVNVVYLCVLPIGGSPDVMGVMERGISFAANDRVGVAAAEAIGGAGFTLVMAVLIMVATFGCQNGCILSGARVYYSMAKDGLFFKPLGKLNSRGVPANALWLQGAWACLLILSGGYNNLLDYVMFAVIIFYIFTIAGIFILRRTKPDIERPYKAPLYPLLPILYLLLATAFVVVLLTQKPEYTQRGLFIVGLGLPAYYLFKYLEKRKA